MNLTCVKQLLSLLCTLSQQLEGQNFHFSLTIPFWAVCTILQEKGKTQILDFDNVGKVLPKME